MSFVSLDRTHRHPPRARACDTEPRCTLAPHILERPYDLIPETRCHMLTTVASAIVGTALMIRMIKALFWSSLSRPWFISKELRPYYNQVIATRKQAKKQLEQDDLNRRAREYAWEQRRETERRLGIRKH